MDLHHIKLENFDTCLPIPEDLIFVALRQGVTIVKEPIEAIQFTDLERLIMGLEAFDLSFVKDSDFRKQNSQICPYVPPAPTLEIEVINSVGIYWNYPHLVVVKKSSDNVNFTYWDQGADESSGVLNQSLFTGIAPTGYYMLVDEVNNISSPSVLYTMPE